MLFWWAVNMQSGYTFAWLNKQYLAWYPSTLCLHMSFHMNSTISAMGFIKLTSYLGTYSIWDIVTPDVISLNCSNIMWPSVNHVFSTLLGKHSYGCSVQRHTCTCLFPAYMFNNDPSTVSLVGYILRCR